MLCRTARFFILTVSLFNMGCSVFGIRSEEQPSYTVVTQKGDKEVRRYKPYIVAKATVETEDFKRAQSEAFDILGGYIFGKNESQKKIQMTAPVTQSKPQSEKIAMTAPVTQERADRGWTMAFVMPSQYRLSDLPRPLDDRVKFEQVGEKLMAAIRFTWLTDDEKNRRKADDLRKWLKTENAYHAVGEHLYAGYDPPWTVPFLRRQEVLIEVESVR